MIRHCAGSRWLLFFFGLVVGLIIIPLLLYFYAASGRAPVAVSDAELPFEDLLTSAPRKAQVEKASRVSPPIPADEPNLLKGAQVYLHYCAVCHGLPVGRVTKIASGMFPPPPQLFHGKGVTDDSVGETFWKTANGLRLSGMPRFRGTLSDTEIWQVSLLLAQADRLPKPVRDELETAGEKREKHRP
jgi:thiosulfate dehydrogenase